MAACSQPVGWLTLALALLALPVAAQAQEGPAGITTRQRLPAHDPNVAACAAPKGLQRSLVFSAENERAFIDGVRSGLEMAAKDRKLAFTASVARSDPALQKQQLEQALAAKTGALVVAPVDPYGLSRSVQRLIWSGAFVGSVVPPPATLILNAPQYLTGKQLADEAVAYINGEFGGSANVVLLTQDSLEFLAPRFVAIRDALRAMPGVSIVADISPNPVSKEGGEATMRLILEAHPKVDVVLGADAVVLGALAALRKAGKARPDQYLGGIDGEPEAIAEIRTSGGGPYKTSVALASPVFGYAMGQQAADWLEGKSVPQAMDILPVALTADNLAAYEADLRDPGAVYADQERRNAYLRMYGNICYETRDRYLNFPWSSEAR